jgi:hypothetical protein
MYYKDNTQLNNRRKTMDASITSLEDVKTKKISFNVEIQSLELADNLVKLLKTNRTTVLMTLIGLGIPSYIKNLRENWEKLKKSRPEKVQKINELLKGLSEIEKKHIKRSY